MDDLAQLRERIKRLEDIEEHRHPRVALIPKELEWCSKLTWKQQLALFALELVICYLLFFHIMTPKE